MAANRKPPRKASASEDGTTVLINEADVPLLTVEIVQQWFREAFHCNPSSEIVEPLVQDINHCAFLSNFWSERGDKVRRSSPSRIRIKRIGEALAVLRKDIPELIADNRRIRPNNSNDSFLRLLKSVNELAPMFPQQSGERGRRPKLWHNIARNLGHKIVTIARASGVRRAGLGQSTAPAILVLKSVLKFLGVDCEESAIVDALRNPRDRSKKGNPLPGK